MQIKTKKGYDLFEISSVLQKAIRRGETDLAGYAAIELADSGYHQYAWKRLLVVSAEDCAGPITQEVIALYDAFQKANEPKQEKLKGRIFLAKAVILLCQSKKSRDADHLVCHIHDGDMLAAERLTKALDQARRKPEQIPLPEYTFDCHTRKGRARGKTKAQFFREEFLALSPRVQGEFDWTVEDPQ